MTDLKNFPITENDNPKGFISLLSENRPENVHALMTWKLLKDSFTDDQFKLLLNGPSLVVPYSFIEDEPAWADIEVVEWLEETRDRIQEAIDDFKKLWKMT